jgi:hypothetical protein
MGEAARARPKRSRDGATLPSPESRSRAAQRTRLAEAPRRRTKQARESVKIPLEEPVFDEGSFVEEAVGAEGVEELLSDAEVAASSAPLSSDDRQEDLFGRLNEGALAALRAATGIAHAAGSDVVHMEHLLAGLFDTSGGPVRSAITAKLTPEKFRELLERASQSRVPASNAYRSVELDHMPTISAHTRQGLLLARRLADSEESAIRGRHMFFGAMSVEECDPVRALLDAGVDPRAPLTDEEHPITPPPTGDPLNVSPLLTASASAQTDLPTTQDRLGYAPVVAALRALLTGSQTTFPLTIAISAPWGGGKSSVMRLLRDQLRASGGRPGWVIVEFPAWRYETGEQLWAAMAKATYDAALDPTRLNWYQRLMFRIRLELRRSSPWRWVVRAVVIVLGVLIGLVVGNLAATQLAAGAAALGLGALVAIVQGLWVGFGDDFKRAIESLASKPTIAEGDGFGLGAAKQVDSLMRELLANDGKVAIFIDDLDRCTPDNVVRVIEAVNQIFVAGADIASEPGKPPAGSTAPTVEDKPRRLVFIMGMDRQVVARGIEVRYEAVRKRLAETGDAAGDAYGLSFLDKIVQLWVTLPTPRPKALQRLLASIAGIDEVWLRERESAHREHAVVGGRGPDVPIEDGGGTVAQDETTDEASLPEPPPEATDSPAVWEALLVGAAALEQNPRQVKRFNNAFRLQLQLVLRSSTEEFTDDQLKGLARWVAIRLRWGELAHAMDEEPGLLGALERSASNDGGPVTEPADVSEEHRKWLDPGTFEDLPALQAILRSGTDGERLSGLPFDRFIRIA